MLAESPKDPFLEVLQQESLPPPTASSATGRRNRNRVGISPTENCRLSTAHVKERQAVLMAAYEKHPERFKGKMPKPMNLPDAVWINKPASAQSEPAQH